MARYTYDAWGNHTVYGKKGGVDRSKTSIGNVNPFRYRGYYYDTETGFYYLQTRYYDPTICRFINADNYELVADLASSMQLNMYAYCGNNPVMCSLIYNLGKNSSNSVYSNIILRNSNVSTKSIAGRTSSAPFANIVSMTNYSTTLVDSVLFSMVVGNITHTITTQHKEAGIFYAYTNIGNSTSSAGLGFNIGNWYGANVYVSSNIGIGSSMQIARYATIGAEVSVLDGISFSLGTISGNVTNETTVSVGWGTLAFAYVACGSIAAAPIPGARIAAGAAVCIILLMDIIYI